MGWEEGCGEEISTHSNSTTNLYVEGLRTWNIELGGGGQMKKEGERSGVGGKGSGEGWWEGICNSTTITFMLKEEY